MRSRRLSIGILPSGCSRFPSNDMAKTSIIVQDVLEVMIREPEGFNPVANFVSRVLDREQR